MRSPCKLVLLALAGVLPTILPAWAGELQRFSYAQVHLGMKVRLTVYAPDQAAAEAACRAGFARVAQLDAMLSDYRPASELSRLSAAAGGPPVAVSPELWRVLSAAEQVTARTHGAFDASVGPVVALWRTARRLRQLPTAAQRTAALAVTGWRHVHLEAGAHSVRLDLPGMKLDLGGIAKGYIGDEAVATLRAHGCPSGLFEAGGDIVLGEAPPGRPGWRIAFENGRTLELSNVGVSASGDTSQFVVLGGQRYSHVVDPSTGLGLTSRLAANVVAVDGITADALSTAITVLGLAAGTEVLAHWPGAWGWLRALPQDPLPQPRQRRYSDRGLLG